MTIEELKARVAELEIENQQQKKVLQEVRRFAEHLERGCEDPEDEEDWEYEIRELDSDMVAMDLYEILRGDPYFDD